MHNGRLAEGVYTRSLYKSLGEHSLCRNASGACRSQSRSRPPSAFSARRSTCPFREQFCSANGNYVFRRDHVPMAFALLAHVRRSVAPPPHQQDTKKNLQSSHRPTRRSLSPLSLLCHLLPSGSVYTQTITRQTLTLGMIHNHALFFNLLPHRPS